MVEVIRAKRSDEAVLDNLLQLYLLEFSEIDGSLAANDSQFEYPRLRQYWDEPERHPFLFMAEGEPVGFALIKKGSEIAKDTDSMDVAEFFVLEDQRLKGIGRIAFGDIVQMFPGPWLVRVLDKHQAAVAFWRRAISAVAGSEIDLRDIDDGQRKWIVFSFVYTDSVGAGSQNPSGPKSG